MIQRPNEHSSSIHVLPAFQIDVEKKKTSEVEVSRFETLKHVSWMDFDVK